MQPAKPTPALRDDLISGGTIRPAFLLRVTSKHSERSAYVLWAGDWPGTVNKLSVENLRLYITLFRKIKTPQTAAAGLMRDPEDMRIGDAVRDFMEARTLFGFEKSACVELVIVVEAETLDWVAGIVGPSFCNDGNNGGRGGASCCKRGGPVADGLDGTFLNMGAPSFRVNLLPFQPPLF
ncbi:hypothetical protein BDZ91DRAFT_764198 [Kalaharituber pfeilii]|nr:hypothetical protein BDZ91DRAFT_764198 [Kalaharituber pfeilii]